LYGNVLAEQHGRYIVGTIRFREASDAKQIISQISEKLR